MKEKDALKKFCPMMSWNFSGADLSNCVGSQCAVWKSWEYTTASEIGVHVVLGELQIEAPADYKRDASKGKRWVFIEKRKGLGECGLISKDLEN